MRPTSPAPAPAPAGPEDAKAPGPKAPGPKAPEEPKDPDATPALRDPFASFIGATVTTAAAAPAAPPIDPSKAKGPTEDCDRVSREPALAAVHATDPP